MQHSAPLQYSAFCDIYAAVLLTNSSPTLDGGGIGFSCVMRLGAEMDFERAPGRAAYDLKMPQRNQRNLHMVLSRFIRNPLLVLTSVGTDGSPSFENLGQTPALGERFGLPQKGQ